MQTTPSSLRILDVYPYNQFTVTCTARAELEGEAVPLNIIVEWIVRKQTPSSGDISYYPPSTEYRTTGSPQNGYLSTINTTETDTVNTIRYRCRAIFSTKIIRMIKDTTVKVVGMLCVVTDYRLCMHCMSLHNPLSCDYLVIPVLVVFLIYIVLYLYIS